jgi:hypothetical protein
MTLRRLVPAALLVCGWHAVAQSQPVWYSLGLESRNVSCLLADDTTMILAGTDQGLYVLWGGEWTQVTGGIAANAQVTALARLASGGVVATVGGGSNSDGVYVGEIRIYGPPFYIFTLLEWVEMPQSLAVRGAKTDTL